MKVIIQITDNKGKIAFFRNMVGKNAVGLVGRSDAKQFLVANWDVIKNHVLALSTFDWIAEVSVVITF